MTILYKLLGVPGTIDEFVDKVKRKGITTATVETHLEIENELVDWRTGEFLAADFVDYITVCAGKFQYSSRDPEYSVSTPSSFLYDPDSVEMVMKKLRKKTLRVAERLSDLGLDAKLKNYSAWETFDPITIEAAKKIIGGR